jgi:hypothetical protein
MSAKVNTNLNTFEIIFFISYTCCDEFVLSLLALFLIQGVLLNLSKLLYRSGYHHLHNVIRAKTQCVCQKSRYEQVQIYWATSVLRNTLIFIAPEWNLAQSESRCQPEPDSPENACFIMFYP